jgi:hypothetical protein
MTKNMGERQRANRRFAKRVNAEEAATILGKTRRTICRWERAGKMPPKANYPTDRLRLYREADIAKMAANSGQGGLEAKDAHEEPTPRLFDPLGHGK